MPEVELTFSNPLNVSVQIGDVAYFSNPNPVGVNREWASTTTPHQTNAQGDIIKIGTIIDIVINPPIYTLVCDMPQDLYNSYYQELVPGGCIQTVSPVQTDCSDQCCLVTPIIDYPVFNYSTASGNVHNQATEHARNYFFSNPTVAPNEVMFHHAQADYLLNYQLPNQPVCVVNPGEKNVNGVDDYVIGLDNYWIRFVFAPGTVANPPPLAVQAIDDWNQLYNFSVSGMFGATYTSFSTNDLISHLSSFFPNEYYLGMSYQEAKAATASTGIRFGSGFGAVGGSLNVQTEEICTQGSYIMFSKDNKANMSSMLGYYASVEYRNNSTTKAELFNVGAEVFESSK